MTFEEIMKEITSGLTGDPDHDFHYLNEQGEKYKDSEYAKEVLRACGRLMYNCLPEEEKAKFEAAVKKDQLGVDAAIEEANYNVHKENYEMAEKILRDMIKRVEECDMFRDDAVSEYHTFHKPMEDILYRYWEKPTKDIRYATEPYSELYFAYGSCLHGMGKYEEALDALKKAIHWNPADVRILFEYAETWKRMGDLDRFFEITKDTFKYAFRAKDVARCCRNVAYYFVEKKDWKPAIGYLLCSRSYDPESTMVQSELYYIQNSCGDEFEQPAIEFMNEIADQYGIPFGPSGDVIRIAYTLSKRALEEKDYEQAHHFAVIANDLADAEETREILKEAEANRLVE